MNGPASAMSVKLRLDSEPSSHSTMSLKENGLGDRFMASEVSAVARLDTATPARINVNTLASREASTYSTAVPASAVVMAATGRASANAPASPK